MAPEQQSTVDTGVRVGQFGLVRSHSQPFNNLKRQLIKSISCSCQAATLLMANSDHVAGHSHTINQALKHATSEAFYQVKKRYIYNLDPQDTLLGELNPEYQGLLFPECSPESLDLESILGDTVHPEVKLRITSTVNQSLAANRDKVQVFDSTFRSLYKAASSLVNDMAETLRCFWQV